jgi:hypothetical protein
MVALDLPLVAFVLLATPAVAWLHPALSSSVRSSQGRSGIQFATPAELAPVASNKKRLVLVRHGEVDLAQFNGV